MDIKTYGEIIRERMKGSNNAQGHPVTIRMLERATGYSYEQIRKVVRDMPVLSRDLNQKLCEYLGLDPAQMWSIAEREKYARRFSNIAPNVAPPPDARFREVWHMLTPQDKDRLWTIVKGMATANESAGLTLPRAASKASARTKK